MFIKSLEFEDRRLGWKLEQTEFGPFNLLVGASGSGKTRILQAINALSRASQNRTHVPGPLAFTAVIENEGIDYLWRLETASAASFSDAGSSRRPGEIGVVAEHISSGGHEWINRSQERIVFNGSELPFQPQATSMLSLVNTPPLFQLGQTLAEFILLEAEASATAVVGEKFISEMIPVIQPSGFVSTWFNLDAVVKAYLLQERSPVEFSRLKDEFTSVFPFVRDLRIAKTPVDEGWLELRVEVFETNVSTPIPAAALSSGMKKALAMLVHLRTAPRGAVFLLDELENSLGVNCLGPVTDVMLSRTPDVQFFLTSHHPYLIDKVQMDDWLVVTRRGSTVRTLRTKDIPALQGRSAQDAFIRLINAREFEEGIS